jgi:hypothetical protein
VKVVSFHVPPGESPRFGFFVSDRKQPADRGQIAFRFGIAQTSGLGQRGYRPQTGRFVNRFHELIEQLAQFGRACRVANQFDPWPAVASERFVP